jgi:hypothetical protein
MKARQVRSLAVAALPLFAGICSAPAAFAQEEGSPSGPRYTYLDAGYQWSDVNYAIKQLGGQHEGIRANLSVGITEIGPVGLHLFGEFFDGDFDGARTCPQSRDSQSFAAGLGASYGLGEKADLVARIGYVDTEIEVPIESCAAFETVSDDGYLSEGLVRMELSDKVEIEAGARYAELQDSDIGNTDVILGIGYHVTDFLSLRARGVVFDDDTGFELAVRLYFGSFLGRDTLF